MFGETERYRILLLADVPRTLPQVAAWLYHEWWSRNPDNSLQTVIERLEECRNHDCLEMTLVCLEGGTPVGTVSLVRHDLDGRPDLTPWLAALYVVPDHRGSGVGTRLVHAALEHAARIREPRLYLFTMSAQAFYRGLGWNETGRVPIGDREAVIFEKATGAPAPRQTTLHG